MTRHVGQIQPMKKWIILNSFYAVPFAVIIRQAPLSAMLHLQAIPKHKPMLVPHGRRSVEALSPLVFVPASRHVQTALSFRLGQ